MAPTGGASGQGTPAEKQTVLSLIFYNDLILLGDIYASFNPYYLRFSNYELDISAAFFKTNHSTCSVQGGLVNEPVYLKNDISLPTSPVKKSLITNLVLSG